MLSMLSARSNQTEEVCGWIVRMAAHEDDYDYLYKVVLVLSQVVVCPFGYCVLIQPNFHCWTGSDREWFLLKLLKLCQYFGCLFFKGALPPACTKGIPWNWTECLMRLATPQLEKHTFCLTLMVSWRWEKTLKQRLSCKAWGVSMPTFEIDFRGLATSKVHSRRILQPRRKLISGVSHFLQP